MFYKLGVGSDLKLGYICHRIQVKINHSVQVVLAVMLRVKFVVAHVGVASMG